MTEKPATQKEQMSQLWQAVIGNGVEGLVGRFTRIEDKMDEHTRWHLAQRGAIALALGGWIVAVAAGLFALFGG